MGVAAVDGNLIDLLWVRKDVRGEGVGGVLMDRIEAKLTSGNEFAEVECFEPNKRTVQFYEARGYGVVRRYQDEASGVGKVVMRKELGGTRG